jgi:hypothetical protein
LRYLSLSSTRFRWAVCQLDILKRLKPDGSTIRAALSNLPKTLDETYERIFLAIPEGDWLSVRHVFHWLVYHNDLFGNNIPLSILLQAIQQSTSDVRSQDADQLYDFEGLRERCGCLIMVEQSQRNDAQDTVRQDTTVSFAHYTVKEYLQSHRNSQKRVGFFALVQEVIQKQFAEIALRQALAITPDALAQYHEVDGQDNLYRLINEDFKLYCGVSSTVQLYMWSESISSDSTLLELSEEFVNPHRLAHGDLCALLSTADDYHYLDNLDVVGGLEFWKIHKTEASDPSVAVFLAFIGTSISSGIPHLALTFARRHKMLPVLRHHLDMKLKIWGIADLIDSHEYRLVGSIPEVVAQLAFTHWAAFDLILTLIFELGTACFDLSALMLLYIGGHVDVRCEKRCSLERLLRFGASANGPEGAFVTPLQIAVVCWDFDGMEILLNAGADPNALGKSGSGWASDSSMERFNRLHGASPLHIIKHFECNYDEEIKENLGLDETGRAKIEARLLEIGAVEIAPDDSEPESDDLYDDIYLYDDISGGTSDGVSDDISDKASDDSSDEVSNNISNEAPPSPTLLALPLLPRP